MGRAYSLLEVKALDPAGRRLTGIASTPELDRHGDLLDLAGLTFRNPIPFLLHHDDKTPIGLATLAVVDGVLAFDATIAEVDEPGPLKTTADHAWQSLKAGVMSGASIGFRVLDNAVKYLATGARQILRAEVCELSLVTIPANQSASVRLVKSLAAPRRQESPMRLTIPEQVATLETKKAERAERAAGILQAAADADRALTPDEGTAHDALALEVKALDADIARWKGAEALNIKQATPVAPRYSRVEVVSNVEPGIRLARYAIAKLAARFDGTDAATYAEKRWGLETPEVALALKAAVAAGNTTDAAWAKPLVTPNVSSDFLPLLRAATIIGKIPGMRNVPFNVSIPAQTGSGAVNWVGEGGVKPVSAMAFATETLGFAKVAGICVLTQELIRFSNPKAEAIVRDSLVADIAKFLDEQFTNPAVAAVAGLNPASITNGAPTAPATTNPIADIMGLINSFVVAGLPIDGLTFIMNPANAFSLAFRTNADGSPEFPGLGLNGGTWKGISVIVSSSVGALVIALLPPYILYADDGGVTIDASTEASIQMDSAPLSPPDATIVYRSMFQSNMVAIRAERFSTWKRLGANTVKYLTATAWPAPTGTSGVDVSVSTRAKEK